MGLRIIGTNRACSMATVERLLSDIKRVPLQSHRGSAGVADTIGKRGVRVVGYGHWSTLNGLEQAAGLANGKPREKFTRIEEMLAALES